MGFGSVLNDFESLSKYFIESIENNFTMHDIYKDRVDKFFKFRHTNNCKRIFDIIVND